MEKWTKITDSTNWVLPLDRKLITMCDKAGYAGITVCMADECVKQSLTFVFGHRNSVFVEPGKDYDHNGFPIIWKILDDIEMGGGCGNDQQKQLKPDHRLTKACYKKEKNEWFYRLHPDTVKEVGAKFGV